MKRRDFMAKGILLLSLTNAANAFSSIPFKRSQVSQQKIQDFDFKDKRSKKVIFVTHCFLNQNARIKECAYSPSSITPVVKEIMKHEIGIIQLPCPETQILGLARGSGKEIYDELSEPEARQELKEYVRQIMDLAHEYQKFGFKVLGVLGIDGSPCCGVKLYYYGGEKSGTGAFMEEIIPQMASLNPPVPVIGIKDAEVKEAIKIVRDLVKSM